METLKQEQIEGLQEHQAIKHGWVRALACITLPFLFAYAAILVINAQLQVTNHMLHGVNVVFTIACAVAGIVLSWIGICGGSPAMWWRAYARRNVRGYVVRFVFVDKPVSDALGEWPRLQHDIRTRKEDADDRWQTHRVHAPLGESNVAISLSLGGWFAQSWIRGIDRDQIGRLQGWSVRLRAIFSTGAVMVEVRHQNCRWNVDERIVTDIEDALRHLEYVATDTMHALNGSWSDIIAHLVNAEDAAASQDMEFHRHKRTMFEILHDVDADSAVTDLEWIEDRVRRLIAERDAARGEVDRYKDGFLPAAVKDLDDAVHFVNDLDIALQESHRLRTVIEGLRLRLRILEWLKQHDPRWTEEGPESLAPILASVGAELADKEKRDRRRHGKAKVDPAPAPAA